MYMYWLVRNQHRHLNSCERTVDTTRSQMPLQSPSMRVYNCKANPASARFGDFPEKVLRVPPNSELAFSSLHTGLDHNGTN